jgi:hypothetical protein
MPKGGARTSSGPPPDPNALRRDRPSDAAGWTTLPAGGFAGEIPAWPLTEATPREDVLWSAAWRSPQAAAWARMGWSHDVALYVRHLGLAEAGDMKAAGEARQWSDRLGLNPAAMLRNRWRVAPDEVGQRRETRQAPATVRVSARDRLAKVAAGG